MSLGGGGPITNWNKIVPIRLRLLMWRINWDRIPTKRNLVRRGVTLENESCPLCNDAPETTVHIFVECAKSKEVRYVINAWRKVFAIDCSGLEDIIIPATSANKRAELIKDVILHAYIGAIWRNRNDIVFNNTTFNVARIANDVQADAFIWIRFRSNFGISLSWLDWCCNSFSV